MDTRMDSRGGVGLWDGAPRTLCGHFAAGGRDHSMWDLEAGGGPPALSGFTAGLMTKWRRSPAGVHRASVRRRGGDVLCEAMLLEPADGYASSVGASTAGATSGGATFGGTSWP